MELVLFKRILYVLWAINDWIQLSRSTGQKALACISHVIPHNVSWTNPLSIRRFDMNIRALGSGTEFSAFVLEDGEFLVAHWLRSPDNDSTVMIVGDEAQFVSIVKRAHYKLQFFASTSPSKNPLDYVSY